MEQLTLFKMSLSWNDINRIEDMNVCKQIGFIYSMKTRLEALELMGFNISNILEHRESL